MINSMTAYARQIYRGEEGELIWEIRSVNHRYLEVFVRLPEDLRGLEPTVRDRVGQRLKRGKLDCALRYQPGTAAPANLSINRPLVQSLRSAAEEVGEIMGSSAMPTPTEVMRWPGVLREGELDLDPLQARAADLLERTLEELAATRGREGEALAQVIRQRSDSLLEHTRTVRQRMPQVLAEIRARISARLSEVSEQMDATRLEQEMVLLAQRLDVDEEMERLAVHLEEVRRVVDQGGVVGRRLDFLMQELNRETNTLTSKTSDVEVTRRAVDMKVLIEQMREQIQNIE
jgi:uncharacterized protein (TIGR00255 family)